MLWVPVSSHTTSKPCSFTAKMKGSGPLNLKVQMSLYSQSNFLGTLAFLLSPHINSFPLCCHCSVNVSES